MTWDLAMTSVALLLSTAVACFPSGPRYDHCLGLVVIASAPDSTFTLTTSTLLAMDR